MVTISYDRQYHFLIAQVDISKLRVFYMESFGNHPLLSRVHPDMKEAQLKVVRHLQEAHQMKVEKVKCQTYPYNINFYFCKNSIVNQFHHYRCT